MRNRTNLKWAQTSKCDLAVIFLFDTLYNNQILGLWSGWWARKGTGQTLRMGLGTNSELV